MLSARPFRSTEVINAWVCSKPHQAWNAFWRWLAVDHFYLGGSACKVVIEASVQSSLTTDLCLSIVCTVLRSVQFIFSAAPFLWYLLPSNFLKPFLELPGSLRTRCWHTFHHLYVKHLKLRARFLLNRGQKYRKGPDHIVLLLIMVHCCLFRKRINKCFDISDTSLPWESKTSEPHTSLWANFQNARRATLVNSYELALVSIWRVRHQKDCFFEAERFRKSPIYSPHIQTNRTWFTCSSPSCQVLMLLTNVVSN